MDGKDQELGLSLAAFQEAREAEELGLEPEFPYGFQCGIQFVNLFHDNVEKKCCKEEEEGKYNGLVNRNLWLTSCGSDLEERPINSQLVLDFCSCKLRN